MIDFVVSFSNLFILALLKWELIVV